MMLRKKIAFTILEVLTVTIILGTLVGFAVPRYMESQKTARANTFVANVREIKSALEAYRASSGVGEQLEYPTSLIELQDFTKDPVNPYTSQTMLSSDPLASGIIYSSDSLTYLLCVIQRDVDDINKNDIVDEPLPMFAEETCDSQAIPIADGRSIMLVAKPTGGGSPSTSPNNVSVGDTVTLSANPNPCYTFAGWLSSDVTISNNKFVMPDKNVTIVANYTATQYTINAMSNNPLYGTVIGAGTYDCGKQATLIAIPTTGAVFNGWYENNNQVSTNTTYTFTVSGDRTLEAKFSAIPYTITLVSNPTGAGSPTATPNPATPGDTVTLTANPSSCYTFSNWTAPVGVTITNNSFVMPAKNVTVTANYAIKKYNVTLGVNNSSFGTVTGGGTYNCGNDVTISAMPKTGYRFVNWSDGDTNQSRTITVTSDINLIANFIANTYTITLKSNPTGVGLPSASPNPASAGQLITLSANPNNCYNFDGWTAPTSLSGNTLIMPAQNITVTANYSIKMYTITLTSMVDYWYWGYVRYDDGGMFWIYLNGSDVGPYGNIATPTTYGCGNSITITAIPYTGFRFVRWSDGNTNISRTFVLTDNINLTAVFEEAEYTLTLLTNGCGSVYGGGYGIPANMASYIVAVPCDHYLFDHWSDGDTNSGRWITVDRDITLTAYFKEDPTYPFYNLNITTVGCGTVNGGGRYPGGTDVSLSAVPCNGYSFDHWSDGNRDPSRTIKMTNNVNLTAYFIQSYSLTVEVEGCGMVWVSCMGSLYDIDCPYNPIAIGDNERQGTVVYPPGSLVLLSGSGCSGPWDDGNIVPVPYYDFPDMSGPYIILNRNLTFRVIFTREGW